MQHTPKNYIIARPDGSKLTYTFVTIQHLWAWAVTFIGITDVVGATGRTVCRYYAFLKE